MRLRQDGKENPEPWSSFDWWQCFVATVGY